MIQSYVYKITCIPTGQYYFGSRSGHRVKNILPEDDLWKEYFTSSNTIKKLINKHGVENFQYEILFKHDNVKVCYWYEQLYIEIYMKDKLCINKHYVNPDNNNSVFGKCGDTKYKNIEMVDNNNNIVMISNLIDYCIENNLDYKSMVEVINGKSFSHKGYRLVNNINYTPYNFKIYTFINPLGEIVEIDDLYKFCIENDLNRRHMIAVFKGKEKSHKGYKLYKTENYDIIMESYKTKMVRNFSYKKSDEQKEKLSKKFSGKDNPAAAYFTIISPIGVKYYIKGRLEEFCKNTKGMCSAIYVRKKLKNNINDYRGWKFYKGLV